MIDNPPIHEENTPFSFENHNTGDIRKRFLHINNLRLTRMRESLANRHGMVLDILPLLFHTNHPMMPGFVKSTAPAKIANYHPSKDELLASKFVARSFIYRPQLNKKPDITGLYIMGSAGSIAQSEHSDLDIWICHNPSLSSYELKQLQKKCDLITQWAEQKKLEIHFFLMNPNAFKHGKLAALDTESSGSMQHLLLLDEFYRSAIYLAGAMPAWWFVPADTHINYQYYLDQLIHCRLIKQDEIIDFGDTSHIPSNEFIGAGIWQLYKAIKSPYKSVLKLLLLEAYVSQHPNIHPLSHTFKELVFSDEKNINNLDSYVLVYQKIEDYLLLCNQPQRLELVRRCLYLKISTPLSKPINGRQKIWQRHQLEKMVKAWGWTKEQLQYIDKHHSWKARQVYAERNMLVSELNHSYRILLKFSDTIGAQKTHHNRSISTEELAILGRQLNAEFERRPGKIEWINPNISHDLTEQTIKLKKTHTNENDTLWQCSSPHGEDINTMIHVAIQDSGVTHKNQEMPLRSPASLVEILLWLQINKVSTEYCHFELDFSPELNQTTLRKIIHNLRHWEPLSFSSPSQKNFQRSVYTSHILILLNIDKPIHHKSQSPCPNNPLFNYNSTNNFDVFSVDIVTRNSWNEITVEHISNKKTLLSMLIEILQLNPPNKKNRLPKLQIESFDSDYTINIANKVEIWLTEILHCFYRDNPISTRYIYEHLNKIYCLHFKNMKPRITKLDSVDQLTDHLSSDQTQYSPIIFDSQSINYHPLKEITKKAKPGAIYVFYQSFDLGIDIYIIDERGSLVHLLYRGRKDHNPLNPLHRFIRTIIQRQLLTKIDSTTNIDILPTYFFQYKKVQKNDFKLIRRDISPESNQNPNLEICATAYNKDITNDNGETHTNLVYDFHCGDQTFRYQEHGKNIFSVMAHHIISHRKNNDTYPIYLTDLNLTLWKKQDTELADLQTSHYLRIKNVLEFQLNKAVHDIQSHKEG